MAIITTAQIVDGITQTLHPAHKAKVYVVSADIDFAKVATLKGSALAAGDVIEGLRIPTEATIITAGLKVLTPVGGGVSVLTVDVGTGIDVDAFVDGYDLFAATAGSYAQKPSAGVEAVIGQTTDTLDLTLVTQTGTLATGVVRLFAVISNDFGDINAGIVQLKS